jgi:hypothetical protein
MKRTFLLILTLGLFAGAAYAHNGMVHVMGTVTAVTDNSISAKAMNGAVQTVALTSDTKYLRVMLPLHPRRSRSATISSFTQPGSPITSQWQRSKWER